MHAGGHGRSGWRRGRGSAGTPPARAGAAPVLLAVGSAGAVGALCRYGVAALWTVSRGAFPWATFSINVSGSFGIGLALVLLGSRFPSSRLARPLVVTGLLGAYTTFSTYMVDADTLVRGGRVLTAVIYLLASAAAGLAATVGGLALGRAMFRRLPVGGGGALG